jgi:hypothetical protein
VSASEQLAQVGTDIEDKHKENRHHQYDERDQRKLDDVQQYIHISHLLLIHRIGPPARCCAGSSSCDYTARRHRV